MLTDDFAQPLEAAAAMIGFHRPWCVAGGWAIDLWLGKVTRNHADVDLAVLRDHQFDLRQHLPEFTFKVASMDRRLVPWKDPRQMLMLPVHELHASDRATGRAFEFLLNESDGIDWIFRRDFDTRLNLAGWIWRGAGNVPVLNPLIVLLYKSKRPEPKDTLDFHVALDRLTDGQKTWLRTALLRQDENHPWLNDLAA